MAKTLATLDLAWGDTRLQLPLGYKVIGVEKFRGYHDTEALRIHVVADWRNRRHLAIAHMIVNEGELLPGEHVGSVYWNEGEYCHIFMEDRLSELY